MYQEYIDCPVKFLPVAVKCCSIKHVTIFVSRVLTPFYLFFFFFSFFSENSRFIHPSPTCSRTQTYIPLFFLADHPPIHSFIHSIIYFIYFPFNKIKIKINKSPFGRKKKKKKEKEKKKKEKRKKKGRRKKEHKKKKEKKDEKLVCRRHLTMPAKMLVSPR